MLMFCFSELKKRLKNEQKAKEKAEKEQAKAATTGQSEKKVSNAEEEISPNVRKPSKKAYFGYSFHLEGVGKFFHISASRAYFAPPNVSSLKKPLSKHTSVLHECSVFSSQVPPPAICCDP